MSLYIDLTEFLSRPTATGIQRIAGEMCRCMPEGAATLVRLNDYRYVALSTKLTALIGRYFRDPTPAGTAEIYRLGSIETGYLKVSETDTVLVPEVFDDERRLSFFREMPDEELDRFRFVVCDLLPLTNPEYFVPDNLLGINQYYKLLRRATHCGFISEATRYAYYRRLKRTESQDGAVLPLGCDSLGARPEHAARNRSLTFAVLGTVEPRKNHRLILDAFEPLLQRLPGLELLFIGKMGWVDSEFANKVRALSSDKRSGFRFCSSLDDHTIRGIVERSRATIYVSAAEGYGLPPVESLWCGTPVIASASIPSLIRLGSAGILYVEPLTVVNLRRAVLAFVDDSYANQKVDEAMRLGLPTWRSFTQEVLNWCRKG